MKGNETLRTIPSWPIYMGILLENRKNKHLIVAAIYLELFFLITNLQFKGGSCCGVTRHSKWLLGFVSKKGPPLTFSKKSQDEGFGKPKIHIHNKTRTRIANVQPLKTNVKTQTGFAYYTCSSLYHQPFCCVRTWKNMSHPWSVRF